MYLKRIELFGFKTFADRTTLEFAPGITAIVGPNGSGKSNIADAVLWCLGEQSLKALRSAQAKDVIFAGSESRRRAGVGEVSLTLDNADGALPLEFSEVTVTRRVFGTGEGEYFINRVPCRLRDIHELFLDTGIGKHAYSLIGQNEVDRILSVRSEDRREIFEQAAGIQRYRQRKNEANHKLERVCANLLRVNDIIHELESQLGPLAQQSEAAREYRRLSKELFDLKLSLLVHERQVLSENLSRARDREAELEREIEAARTRSHQLSAEEVDLRAALQEIEERVEETRGLVSRLEGEAERADGRVALTRQRIEDLRQQAGAAEDELRQLEERLTAAERELAAAADMRPALSARLEELQAQIEERERRLRDELGVLRTAGSTIEQRRAEHLDTLRDLADARNRLVQCEAMLEAARGRIARLAEQRDELAADRQEAHARAAAAAREVEDLQARRERLAAEAYALRSEEDAAEMTAADLRAEELRLREALSSVSSRLRALQEMERTREGLRSGVRAVLAAADAGRLPRAYRTVADLIRAPKELEAAIEAALGPAAGDLVVPSDAEARAAIAYLKESRAGRATFLPQGSMRVASRPESVVHLAGQPGCRGVAADLIECEPGAEAIVEHLLGRVLVTDDLDGALALSKGASGWRSIVTCDGDVVRPWGAITGGSRPAGPQLVGRAREIEELQVEQGRLREALDRAAAAIEETRRRLESLRADAEARRREAEEVGAEQAQAESAAEVLAEKCRIADERDAALASEQEALREEVAQIEQERAEAAARVEELQARKESAEAAMAELETALAGGRDVSEQLREATSDLRVEVTSVQGDLRALDARIEQMGQAREMLERAIAERRALLDRLAQAAREGQGSLESLESEAERLRNHLARAEEELARCQERRQGLLEQLAANRDLTAQTRDELEQLQARLHRCQLRTTQLDSEIGFTERTLMDEYRLSLDEAEQRAGPVESRTAAQARVKELQEAVDALGDVNLGSIEEYERVRQRLEFLTTQRADLEAAREDLHEAITEIDREATARFLAAFQSLQEGFQDLFVRLFGGGRAELTLTDADNVLECGIDVTVTVPGKKTRDLLQLSGGERALTAAAILFALLKVRPSPFVILDEIDAPLDDSNVGRYRDVLRDFARDCQFIIITHNKETMEAADVLYGVTMEEAGTSKVISVRLRDEGASSAESPLAPAAPTSRA